MSGSSPNMTEREKKKSPNMTERKMSPRMTKKIQGMASRYARRKQRASIKVRAAAIDAVKLATACVIRVFSKTSESESYSKKRGENFLSVHRST